MTSACTTLYIQAMLKKFRYAAEGVLILFAMLFFRLLPLDFASALAGAIARILGPFSRAHRTARANLKIAFPELDDRHCRRILHDMWDNLGRVIGEYPHLSRPIMRRRIAIEGREHFDRIRESGQAAIFISGHFANWEIIPLTAALYGLPMAVIYREANNPVAEWLIRRIRAPYTRSQHGKGRVGAVQAVRALKNGHSIAMLVDQKQNDGAAVAFFGHDAMTTTAPAQLAAKFEVPMVVAHIVRTDGAHFHISIAAPVRYPADADPLAITAEIHRLFEGWIREHPSQWLWVHHRWG